MQYRRDYECKIEGCEHTFKINSDKLSECYLTGIARVRGPRCSHSSRCVGGGGHAGHGDDGGVHLPVRDSGLSDISRSDAGEDTDSFARAGMLVECSDSFLEGLDSLGFGDLSLVVFHECPDSLTDGVDDLRVEVFTHAGKLLADFSHSLFHLGHGDLAVLGLNLVDVVEDRLGLAVAGDGHARDGIKHLEVLDGGGSGVDTLGCLTSSTAFIELADAVLESLDGGSERDFSSMFLGEGSDSVSDGLGSSGVKVVLLAIVEFRESLAGFLQLLASDGHAVVSIDLGEDGPGLVDGGDGQARNGGVRSFSCGLGNSGRSLGTGGVGSSISGSFLGISSFASSISGSSLGMSISFLGISMFASANSGISLGTSFSVSSLLSFSIFNSLDFLKLGFSSFLSGEVSSTRGVDGVSSRAGDGGSTVSGISLEADGHSASDEGG
jgi:hypothetical protein